MENMIDSRISKIGKDKLLIFNCFDMLFLIFITWLFSVDISVHYYINKVWRKKLITPDFIKKYLFHILWIIIFEILWSNFCVRSKCVPLQLFAIKEI